MLSLLYASAGAVFWVSNWGEWLYNENKKDFQLEENLEAQIQEENDEPIEIEVEDRGINTDELPPEELQRLVDNNIELKEENEVTNLAYKIVDKEK